MLLPHGKDELQEFLEHLHNCHLNITFTVVVEQNKTLLLLDVLVSRTLDGSLGRSVYRKSIHTHKHGPLPQLRLDVRSI